MSQAHDHHHHDHVHAEADDPYYLDQMCLVALSAVFGVVCLSLSLWKTKVLSMMLAPQFHPYVLISGAVLLLLALLRGISLWIQVGKEPVIADAPSASVAALPILPLVVPAASASKELAEAVTCGDHDHAHCGHDHHHDEHVHAHGEHVHSHAHAIGENVHSHAGHTHSHGDHDHSWAPWRYVVLLFPIILFFLGIPSDPPKVKASAPEVDQTKEAQKAAALIGRGTMPLSQASAVVSYFVKRPPGESAPLDFQTLRGSADKLGDREYWRGKVVRVRGQFVPNRNPNKKRVFSLGRFYINCCRPDAVQLDVPIIASEDITHVGENEWVQVTGEIQYRRDANDVYHTQLLIQGKDDVDNKIGADPDPYISAK